MAVKAKKAQKKKWIKFRHGVVRNVASIFLRPYIRLKYNAKIEKFQGGARPYLILYNHQTAFDQFFVAMAFKGRIYYVASEDIFSKGWISRAIRYLVAPIPIKKQTTDVRAVMDCIRVGKEGGTIAIAPEGNRTYSGKTEYIKDSIVGLARVLKMPVAFFRIEGGYGVQPRWSDVVRKGKMRAYVSKILEVEEIAALNDTELFETIKRELYVDEAVNDGCYYHKRNAEYLERAVYVCPDCGVAKFVSDKNTIQCQVCKKKIHYLPTKELQGEGFDFPFRFVNDWYVYQAEYIRKLDISQYFEKPIFEDEINLFTVTLYKNKFLKACNVKVSAYADRLTLQYGGKTTTLAFSQLNAVTVLGRNKLNLYFTNDATKVYQWKGDKRFNALKYVHLYYRWKNDEKGEMNGEFLGL